MEDSQKLCQFFLAQFSSCGLFAPLPHPVDLGLGFLTFLKIARAWLMETNSAREGCSITATSHLIFYNKKLTK